MSPYETRHRVIAELLQAGRPLTAAELAARCGLGEADLLPVVQDLANQDQVVSGRLVPDEPATRYCWWAVWRREAEQQTAAAKRGVRAVVSETSREPGERPGLHSPATLAFRDYVVGAYRPPPDKRLLVILQCSVRRPFSSSPSHASMRRAIATATGCDPAHDFVACPVHVVVLASRVGPVPYELEGLYPANVSAGGVKHLRPDAYDEVRPILVERMAEYLRTHRHSYDHIATFTDGRYGDVVTGAGEAAGRALRVLPVPTGPRVVRLGRSQPRKYWEKYWIQLHLDLVEHLTPARRAAAEQRLAELDVEYEPDRA